MGKEAASATGATGTGANPYIAAGSMVAGGVMNLIEANKQADAKRAADRAAEKAIQEAQRQIEQNFLGAVQVPMGAYNNAVLQSVAKQGQSIGALQEAGPRELAGGIGRVNEVSNQETANLTENIADRLYGLNVAQAQEQSATAGKIAALKQAQAQGAQIASMAAEKARIASQFGALNAFGNAATGLSKELTPVYPNTGIPSNTTQPQQNVVQNQPAINQYQNFSGNMLTGGNMFGSNNSMVGEIIGFDFMGNPIYKQ